MREEEFLELVKGLLTNRGPIPATVFLNEVKEEAGNHGIARDELIVEVDKAREGSHVLDFDWGWPGSNPIQLDQVHGELTRFYDHFEVFYLRDIKLAFFELQMKVKFSHPLEDMMGSLFMSLWVGGGDEEVIHVDDEPSFGNHVPE